MRKVVTIIECDREGCEASQEIESEKRPIIGGYKEMGYPDGWKEVPNGSQIHPQCLCPDCAKELDETIDDFMSSKN